MAVIAPTYQTIDDVLKLYDPDGSMAPVIDTTKQDNPVMSMMPLIEGNLPTGDRTTRLVKRPVPSKRRINEHVAATRAEYGQFDEAAEIMTDFSNVDPKLLDMAASPMAARAQFDSDHYSGMEEELANSLIYGNAAADPRSMNGLAVRRSDPAQYADYMFDGTGTGSDNMSIYLVGWGPKTFTGIYPKGSMGGIEMRDIGPRIDTNSNGEMLEVLTTKIEVTRGLAEKNPRCLLRACNISYANLVPLDDQTIDLVDLMIDMMERLPSTTVTDAYRPMFLMPKAILTTLRKQVVDRANVNFTFSDYMGREIDRFGGVPCLRHDALTATEAAITFP